MSTPEVHDAEGKGDEKNAALNHGVVAHFNGTDHEAAKTGNGKDDFREHRATEQDTELDTRDGHDRDKRVGQGMLADDHAFHLPFCAGRADVVLAHDFQHAGAGHAGDDGDRLQRQGKGGHDHGLDGVEARGREQIQFDREKKNEKKTQPEDGH